MNSTVIRVIGIPAPQGSKRAFVRNGKAILTESAGEKHKAWRVAVAGTAHEAWVGRVPLDEPVEVSVCFYLPRPKSERKAIWHAKRPDIDKLLRSTLDGLTDAGVIIDDARISMLHSEKVYTTAGWTGADIRIKPLGETL